jgi:hypothetical protein
MKLDLLTNATVVDDTIRFISGYDKHTTNMSSASEVGAGAGAAANKSKTDTFEQTKETEYLLQQQ